MIASFGTRRLILSNLEEVSANGAGAREGRREVLDAYL